MSITPHDFLSSAKALLSDATETAARNSVSRAYYAAYHQACSVFSPDKEFAKKSESGMHQTYIDQLQEAPANSIQRQVGVKLHAMKSRRVKADYRLDEDFPGKTVAMQISAADELFKTLEQLAAEKEEPCEKAPVQEESEYDTAPSN